MVLALYFPQFHPTPINDYLWGEGFSDWSGLQLGPAANRFGLRIARPLPGWPTATATTGSPGAVGEYFDPRELHIREAQGRAARGHGIDGFLYYHYWFYGGDRFAGASAPTLGEVLERMLQDGQPNLPFALYWVPETWTRKWQGYNSSTSGERGGTGGTVLVQQYFPHVDSPPVRAHYEFLRRFFRDPRYIKVDGLPVMYVYPGVPDTLKERARAILDKFDRWAKEDGLGGIFLVGSYFSFAREDLLSDVKGRRGGKGVWRFKGQARHIALKMGKSRFGAGAGKIKRPFCKAPETSPDSMHETSITEDDCYPVGGVSKMVALPFDNTPRRGLDKAVIDTGADCRGPSGGGEDEGRRCAAQLERELEAAMVAADCCSPGVGVDRFVVIAAWNEWGEGMVLEPSDVYSWRLLEAVNRTVARRAGLCRPAHGGAARVSTVARGGSVAAVGVEAVNRTGEATASTQGGKDLPRRDARLDPTVEIPGVGQSSAIYSWRYPSRRPRIAGGGHPTPRPGRGDGGPRAQRRGDGAPRRAPRRKRWLAAKASPNRPADDLDGVRFEGRGWERDSK